MAIAESSLVTETAACTVSNHRACRGVVYTLTTGLGSPVSECACPCHEPPPVDEDQELEDLLDREADAHLWDWSL
jgi:hypothetical protein